MQYSVNDEQVNLIGDRSLMPWIGVFVVGTVCRRYRGAYDNVSQQERGIVFGLGLGGIFINWKR